MDFRHAWMAYIAAATVPAVAMAEAPTRQEPIGASQSIKLSGSVRVRYETLDGQPRAGFRPQDEQLAVRTTLAAEYRAGGIRVGGELYDSRAYLDRRFSAISANEVNALELVQAYVGADLADALGTGSSLQLQFGRMTLNLGSRRLVAADDYRNTTNGYTGIRADLKFAEGTAATLIYTLPQVRLPDDPASVRDQEVRWDRESFDLRLWGGVLARPNTLAGATAELSYFRLQEHDGPGRPNRNRDLHTLGARIVRDARTGRWDFEAEAMLQLGAVRASVAPDAARLPVQAWFLHLEAGYSIAGAAELRLAVEYDFVSGDGRARRFGRFDTLFGMRRADFAPSGIYNAIGRANIATPALRVEIAPDRRLDAFAAYRAMWLASRTDAFSFTGVRDASGRSGSFAGHQLEARVRYWIVPAALRGEINAVWLAKGHFLRVAPNAPDTGDTRYLSTALTATF